MLVNWVIEGEHYSVKDGKRVFFPEVQKAKTGDPDFQKKTGIGQYVYPFPQYGDGVENSMGNTYITNNPELIKENYTAATNEVLAA